MAWLNGKGAVLIGDVAALFGMIKSVCTAVLDLKVAEPVVISHFIDMMNLVNRINEQSGIPGHLTMFKHVTVATR